MKINRETIYTQVAPVVMKVLAVCLVALTLVSAFMHGWPTTPPSIQTLVVLGHSLAVFLAGLVLARGNLQLVFEFWIDAGLGPILILVASDWRVLPIWLNVIFIGVIVLFWVAGIHKLRMARHADVA